MGFSGTQATYTARAYLMQLLYSRLLMTMPPTQCLLPLLCGKCFPGCLLPPLCGIGIGLGLGTHGFGFGHCAGWTFYGTGNHPLPHLPKKHGKTSGLDLIPYPQFKGPCKSVGVRIPNSRGHAKVWESVSPTQGAMPKRGSLYPQLDRPRKSVGVRIPNSTGHTKAWESVSPTRGATKCGSPYPQIEGPRQNVGTRDRTMKERTQYRHSPLKEFGAALGLGFCYEYRIFTSQQTTFV